MALSEKQFTYLTEMGISLWQQKSPKNKASVNDSEIVNYLPVAKTDIESSSLFNDIILALSLNKGDYTIHDQMIKFEFFDWLFTEQQRFSYNNNQLITPSLSVISNSIKLKKNLWKQLQTID